MDKYKFMKRVFAWIAFISVVVFIIIGATSPVEAGMSAFGHWLKTFFMWVWVTAIVETMMYTVGQIAFHWADDYKDKYGKGWFWKGIKDDFRYMREQFTWKKFFKYVGIYILFFAVCFGIFYVLECLVP